MNARHLVLLAALACSAAWWLALRPDPVSREATAMPSGCPLPPRVASGDAPLQTGVPAGLALPGVGDAIGSATRAQLAAA